MTEEEITPEVKLERLCTNPDFKFGEIDVRFGISDFGKGWSSDKSGFFVKKGDKLKAVDLRGAGLEHELYMPKECLSRVQCMQVHQNQKDKNRFGIIFGMSSGCCDGAVLGGIYTVGTSGEKDDFKVILARQVPFNTFGVAGMVYYHKKESLELDTGVELFALGSGCHGSGVQYLRGREKGGTEQEYIYNDDQLKVDEHIVKRIHNYKSDCSLYHDFQRPDSLSIINGALTAAYCVNIEEAYKVTKEYYIAKELQKKLEEDEERKNTGKKEEKDADNRSSELKGLERKISYIDSTISRIRLSVSQSSFINRNLRSVYP